MALTGTEQIIGTKYVCLLSEAMPSMAASNDVFKNAPLGTREVTFSIRAQAVTVRSDGELVTAGANGRTLAVGHYIWQLDQSALKLIRMIQESATATGYVEYWGVK
jgi:hypothetical protein